MRSGYPREAGAAVRSAPRLRRWVDLLVTGLAVGGGTKPLHDLVSNLQASKEAKKDPPQVIAS